MFDFLAFKALREKKGTSGMHQLYVSGLLPQIQHAAALKGKTVQRCGQNVYVPDFDSKSIDYRIFSDSIILFTKSNSFDAFFRIVVASHALLCSGFAGHKATLRGAIGYGDLIDDANTILIGSAIEDAYIGESSQVWSGCSFTSACEKFISDNQYIQKYTNFFDNDPKKIQNNEDLKNIKNAKKRIVEYEIPEQHNPKTGKIEYSQRKGYVLDWTLNVYEGAGEDAFLGTTSPHAKKIINNTILFEKWARIHNR